MKYLSFILIVAILSIRPVTADTEKLTSLALFDFSAYSESNQWMVVNDTVMGGVSQSQLIVKPPKAVFSGSLSLRNNGGFASVRHSLQPELVANRSNVKIKIKGDGRHYQLRFRTDNYWDSVSYTAVFATEPGVWQEVVFKETDFVPVYRGRLVSNAANFLLSNAQQVGILIADKYQGLFRLEIASIEIF